MEKKVNNRYLVINKSQFNIDRPLDYKDYTIAMFISVTDISRPDNQDGSIDIVFKAKATGELIIKDEFDKVYIKSDKKSLSQRFRFALYNFNESNMDNKEFYNWFMGKMLHHKDSVIPMLLNNFKKLDEGEV